MYSKAASQSKLKNYIKCKIRQSQNPPGKSEQVTNLCLVKKNFIYISLFIDFGLSNFGFSSSYAKK